MNHITVVKENKLLISIQVDDNNYSKALDFCSSLGGDLTENKSKVENKIPPKPKQEMKRKSKKGIFKKEEKEEITFIEDKE
jgi:hypothetical protein